MRHAYVTNFLSLLCVFRREHISAYKYCNDGVIFCRKRYLHQATRGGGIAILWYSLLYCQDDFFCINLYWLHISTCSSSRHRKYRIVDSNDIVWGLDLILTKYNNIIAYHSINNILPFLNIVCSWMEFHVQGTHFYVPAIIIMMER